MPWDDLIAQAKISLADRDAFDARERNYKIAIAAALRNAMEAARDGSDWQSLLKKALTLKTGAQPYNLSHYLQHDWLKKLTPEAAEPVRTVLTLFLEESDPVARFQAYEDLAGRFADKQGGASGAVLVVGSILNSAVDPANLPPVKTTVFEHAEKQVGHRVPRGTPTENYVHHLEFARLAEKRVAAAGLVVNDLLDVQSILWDFYPPNQSPAKIGTTASTGETGDVIKVSSVKTGAQPDKKISPHVEVIPSAAQQPSDVLRRAQAFAQYFPDYVVLTLTKTMLSKKIIDATEPIREMLKQTGAHDFGGQGQGEKSEVPAVLVSVSDSVAARVVTEVSLYRPPSKPDPRFWLHGLRGHSSFGDSLAIGVTVDRTIVAVNLSAAKSDDEWSAVEANFKSLVGKSEPRYALVERRIRDTKATGRVKEQHNHECQICGWRIVTPKGPYVEGCHIVPLGKPHDGDDTDENILALCPSCHVRFDYGGLVVDENLAVREWPTGRETATLRTVAEHAVSSEYLAWHRRHHGAAWSHGG
jgi:hypothetical protein